MAMGRRHAEKRADKDRILEEYVSSETGRQNELRAEWEAKYKRDFDKALNCYRNKREKEFRDLNPPIRGVSGSSQATNIDMHISVEGPQISLGEADLSSIDTAEALGKLQSAGVSPEALIIIPGRVITPELEQALAIVVPDKKEEVKQGLLNPSTRLETEGFLHRLYNKLKDKLPSYEQFRENLRDSVTDELGEKGNETLDHIMSTAAKHPIKIGLMVAGLIGTAVLAYRAGWFTYKDGDQTKVRGWIKYPSLVAGVGLIANQFARLFPGGASLYERAVFKKNENLFNPESSDPIIRQFFVELTAVSDGEDQREAVANIVKLSTLKGNTLARLYRGAKTTADGTKSIDLNSVEAAGIDIKNMDGEALYQGIRGLGIILAEKEGYQSSSKEAKANYGMQLLQGGKYSSQSLENILYATMSDAPQIQTEEGRMHPYDRRFNGALTPDEWTQEQNDEKVLSRNGASLDVRVVEPGIVLVMGHRFKRSVDETAKTITFTDSISGKAFVFPQFEAGKVEIGNQMKAHIESCVQTEFKRYNPGSGYSLAYEAPHREGEAGRWKVRGGKLAPVLGFTTTETPVDLALVEESDGRSLTLIIEGHPEAYPSLEAAVDSARNKYLETQMKERMAYLFGPVAINIVGTTPRSSRRGGPADTLRVDFEYGDHAKGWVEFRNGVPTNLEIPLDKVASRDLEVHLRDYAMNEGLRFADEFGKTEIESLRASFTEHLRTGGHFKTLGIAAEEVKRWWNEQGSEGVFVDEEELWNEEVEATKQKMALLVGTRIYAKVTEGGKVTATPADMSTEIRKIFEDAKTDLAKLKRLDDDIRGMNLEDSAAYVAGINGKRKELGEVLYRNESYKVFKRDIKERLRSKGFDYKGGDRHAQARALFRELDLAVDRLAWPLWVQNKLSAADQSYLNYLKEELPRQASIKLLNKEGDINYGLFVDRRIAELPVEALGVKSRQEFDPTTYKGIPIELPEAGVGGGSASTAPAEGIDDVRLRKTTEGVSKIKKTFEDIRVKAAGNDRFTSYVATVESILGTEMTEEMLGSRTEADFDRIMEKYRQRGVRLVTRLAAVRDWESPTVLDEVGEALTIGLLDDANRREPAQRMFQWFNSYFDADEEIRNSYMLRFLDKFDSGPANSSKQRAEAYALYYRWNTSKILPQEANWHDFNRGEQRDLEKFEWDQALPKMESVIDFKEWNARVDALTAKKKAEGLDTSEEAVLRELMEKPEIVDTNLELAVETRERDEKMKVVEEFMEDWFDQHMDIGELTRLDGSWPEIFRTHVLKRIELDILPRCETSEELRMALVEFSKFVQTERNFYQTIIDLEVEDDQGKRIKIVSALGALGGAGAGAVAGGGVGALGGLIAGGPAGAMGGAALGAKIGAGVGALGGGVGGAVVENNLFPEGIGGFQLPGLTIEGDPTVQMDLEKIMDDNFEIYFLREMETGRTNPRGYAIALKAALTEFIRKAAKDDANQIDLGPIGIQFPGGDFTGQVTP